MKKLKKIILAFAMFFSVPVMSFASEARHMTINTTKGDNVLLGGDYIEMGIHPFGAFRTDGLDGKNYGTFHPNAMSEYAEKKLGLYYNEHIWGEGEPKTNDFTYEKEADAYFLSYKIGSTYKVFGSISTMENPSESGFNKITVTDKTEDSTTLKAEVEAVTPDSVKLIMDISFGVNDKFFITDVKVINNSTSKIEDVRFSKFNYPQLDNEINHTERTYVKVLSNPSSSKEGGEKNFAMISSRGTITKDGWFYFSDSNNARVAVLSPFNNGWEGWNDTIKEMDVSFLNKIWNETTPGIPNYADDDRMSIFYPDETDANDWVLYDPTVEDEDGAPYEPYTAISIKLNDIEATTNDDGVTTRLYTSLNNDIHSGLKEVLTDRISEYVKTRTDKQIEMIVKDGFEYSIDNWTTKNTTGVFNGLTPEKTYTIKLRKSSDGSEATSIDVSTKRSSKDAVDIKLIALSDTAVAFKALNGYEYSKDNGVTWTADNTFKGLDPDTEYTIMGRLQETFEEMPGKTTKLVVKTLKHVDSALDNVHNVDMDINIVDIVPTIYFNSGALYESVMNDEDVKKAVTEHKDVRIMFDIVSITKDADDEKHFEGKTFGFAFDVEIKLYVDNVFIKNINEMGKALELKIAIPENLVKEGRKFFVVRKHETFKDEVDSHGHHNIVVDKETWDILNDEDEDLATITYKNDKFSEFFVVYEDTTKNPRTGDYLLSYVLILVLSTSVLYLYKKLES